MCTLIGIAVDFQCATYLLAREPPILEEARLPSALAEIARRRGAETFAPRRPGGREPIDVGVVQGGLDVGLGHAALGELAANALRALAFCDARANEGFSEPRLGERARGLERGDDGGDDFGGESACV